MPRRNTDEALDDQEPSVRGLRSLPLRLVGALVDEFSRTRPRVPGPPPLVLFGLGLGVVALSVGQVLVDPEPPPAAALEMAVPITATLPVLAAGWWTTRTDRGAQKHAAAVYVSVAFMAIATATVGIIVITQTAQGTMPFDWPFAVTTTMAVGALVGTPTGFVFDEVLARQEALEGEHRATRRLNERLRVVNRVMRHNVRNELTVAMGGLTLLASHIEDPDATVWTERVGDALERLMDHADKLVELGELESSRGRRETVDVVTYIEGFLEAADIRNRTVTIETDLPPAAEVRAHPLIGTAIVEVLDNAIVHTSEEATVEVDVGVVERGDVVEVTVADTGPGISAFEREAIESAAEEPLSHGGGVGLWLTKWVVEASAGELEIESNEPRGTAVRLRLPRAEEVATAPG